MRKLASLPNLLRWPLLAALVTTACLKPSQAGSHVASLDNFARGDGQAVQMNHCGMDLENEASAPPPTASRASRIVASTPALHLSVLSALTAVPEALQSPFFALGGTVEATTAIQDVCGDLPLTAAEHAFASEDGSAPLACWQLHGAGERPVIYVSADPVAIRHALVRVFAYTFEQLLVERLAALAPAASQPALSTALTAFGQQRDKVGAALLTDSQAADPQILSRLSSFKVADSLRYGEFVLAEAADSYYCSPATRATFTSRFPATLAAFVGTSADAVAQQFGPSWFD